MTELRWLIMISLVAQLVLGPGAMFVSQAQQRAGAGRLGPQELRDRGAARLLPPAPSGVMSRKPAKLQLPGGQALSRAVVPDEYILGPGDALSVNLWGEYDDTYLARVTPDGKISIPTIGVLNVKGLSLTEAGALIEAEVKRYYRNVKSGLSLTALRVFEVLVLGEVQRPGTYLATPVKRVSDVVAQAGDVLPGGSHRHIQVRRNGEVYAVADLFKFLRRGDESTNPFVHDGDVIYVPPMGNRRISVYISEISTQAGAITENSIPYTIELKEGERLSTLISSIGGTSPWWDLEGVFIERETKVPEGTMRIPINLRRYLLENDQSQNIVLESGDQVYIPAQIRRVYVAGRVKVPSSYTFIPGRTAEFYLTEAGGPSLTADLRKSFIKRADGAIVPYVGTAEIANGDAIVVMEQTFKTWQDYVSVVNVVTGLFFTGLSLVTTLTVLSE